jgi:penicillin-binding protein 1B
LSQYSHNNLSVNFLAKPATKKSTKASAKPRKKSTKGPVKPKRRYWPILLKLAVVGMVGLGAYLFYLDATIKQHFSGNKWQVPAQVYARPLEINLGQEITKTEVTDELKLLGYRRVASVSGSGEYAVSGSTISFMRRAFHFVEGPQGLRLIRLGWDRSRISRIDESVDLTNGFAESQSLQEISLEPWLVTRLVSSHREDRMLLNIDTVPDMLVKALTLVEDRNFYNHHGVAPMSILRALIANIAAGRTVQGGSTLTQQLVKNLYLTREKSITRKVKEALMSVVIDARYSKDQILQAYLNEVFVGQNGNVGVHGFGLASHFYFDRPVDELNTAEIATLVGLVKGPSYYNPRRYPDRARERRDVVLKVLFENNELTAQDYEKLVNQPLQIASGASLASGKHPAFMDKVRRELSDILADPNIRESGVKVFTTLDINAQRRAEKALSDTVSRLADQQKVPTLEGAMLITDVAKGEIRAIVGSRNTQFKGFNRALDARRPIGSLIKPAVYLAALEEPTRFNLATVLKDEPISFDDEGGKQWQPQNADKEFRGQVSLVESLVRSLNVPTINLGLSVGLGNIAYTLERLGISTPIKQVPALTLGALDLSLLQVNQMYQTIANNGIYYPLHSVKAIASSDNRLLWQHGGFHEARVDEAATYLTNYALHKVTVDGTAKRIKQQFKAINMAGKTGTTDDYRDSWFAGFDRNILVTTWLGEDNNIPTNLTGASGALSAYIAYQKLQEPKSLSRRFPQGLGIAHFYPDTGEVATAGCPNTLTVPAILDVLPPPQVNCDGKEHVVVPPPKPKKKPWWQRIFGDG